MPEFIKTARDGQVAVITLNRPAKLNAWHLPMRYEIRQAFLDANADPSVGAVIVTGSGDRAFSAGQDLEETMKFMAGLVVLMEVPLTVERLPRAPHIS